VITIPDHPLILVPVVMLDDAPFTFHYISTFISLCCYHIEYSMYLPVTPCSLKRTSSVLDEHEEALKKKLEVVQHNTEQQRYVHTAATTATLTSVLHVPCTMTGCYSVICSSAETWKKYSYTMCVGVWFWCKCNKRHISSCAELALTLIEYPTVYYCSLIVLKNW